MTFWRVSALLQLCTAELQPIVLRVGVMPLPTPMPSTCTTVHDRGSLDIRRILLLTSRQEYIHSYLTLGLDVRPPSKQHRDFIASPAVIRPRFMPS